MQHFFIRWSMRMMHGSYVPEKHVRARNSTGLTCKGLLIGLRAVDVALGDIGAANADLPNLSA